LLPETQFKNSYHILPEPSALYVFSDGIYEFAQASGKTWSIEAFIQLLTEKQGAVTSLSTAQIIEAVRAKTESGEFEDDCSILRAQLG
jgi:phosphoserine phosphatase RsbU/P